MTFRAQLATILFVLLPLGIATGILAAQTLGVSLNPGDREGASRTGVAVALLVVVATGYLLLAGQATSRQGSHLPMTLIISGGVCVAAAVALQFYLAFIASQNAMHAADVQIESAKAGHGVPNVNINSSAPASVQGVSYLALFAGVWMAAVGIRIGVVRHDAVECPADEGDTSEEHGGAG